MMTIMYITLPPVLHLPRTEKHIYTTRRHRILRRVKAFGPDLVACHVPHAVIDICTASRHSELFTSIFVVDEQH